ncbi:MAG TPA: ABC-2 transporter permease [Clostridiales bacterium]|nr:ABC-2 transporter permease [Clostridiales bacterium]HQP69203.1 ABC-2 transporter permease [Clostridiales bacterium]
MKNLIMADFKVLGHRIWTIPLGVTILVILLCLIIRNVPNDFRYFLITLLTPGLLIFELLREEYKKKSDRLILTMPVSKSIYVISKYSTFLILGMTAIPAALLTDLIMNFLGNEPEIGYLTNILSEIPKILLMIFFVIYFIYPLYLISKKFAVTAELAVLWINFELIDSRFRYFDLSAFDRNIGSFSIKVILLLCAAGVVHFSIRLFFKKIKTEQIMIIWYLVFIYLTLIFISALTLNLYYSWSYIKEADIIHKWSIKDYELLVRSLKMYILIILTALTACISSLIFLYKKAKEKYYFYSFVYLLIPVILSMLSMALHMITSSFVKANMDFQSFEILFIFIGTIYFSMKASIYLLKNNRTLK